MNPLVSVLMTAYNREKYIAEAIESVLASTFTNFELIIVDDCSSDNTINIARSFEAKDDRIKVYSNDHNLGDYANRNMAASYSTGYYIMNVDSDDKILATGMQQCLDAMLSHPEVDFGMCLHTEKIIEPFFLNPTTSINQHFFKKPFLGIGPGGTIFKRIFFYSIGAYPVKYGPANDMYFNLKAASAAGVLLLPFEFIYYRIHEGQEINNQFAYLYHGYNYMNDALSEIELPITREQKKWLSQKNKRRFLTNITRYFLKTLDFKKTALLIHKTKYGFTDAMDGLFH